MAKGKLILICQSGGEFVTKDDGTLSFEGGEANAVNINLETLFEDLKLQLAEMSNLDQKTVSIKYFLPGNRRNLITLRSDKDLKRMIGFHVNSLTADIFVKGKEGFDHDAAKAQSSNKPPMNTLTMSYSSHSPPTETTEEVERSTNRARREVSVAALTTKHKLVVCFTHVRGSEVSYAFVFFSIEDLLLDDDRFPPLQPERTLQWPDKEKMDASASADVLGEPYFYISFLHSSSAAAKGEEEDGSGVVYAVGGLALHDYDEEYNIPRSLPDMLTRIPLSGNKRMLDDDKKKIRQMNGGKLFPLIEEIGGLIYVLSGPVSCFEPSFVGFKNSFEVYTPADDTWEVLTDPPFISAIEDNKYTPFVGFLEYRHLVFGHKLFVSDGLYSCAYDTVSKTWNACHLFSDCYLSHEIIHRSTNEIYQHDDCGPSFPFLSKALLWKDQIFLCLISEHHTPIAAFRIITDDDDDEEEEKAEPLLLRCEGTLLPYGKGPQIVDLGGDLFALMLFQKLEGAVYGGYEDCVTVFTFKLEIDATAQNRLLVTGLNKRYFEPKGGDTYLGYSFAF